MLTRTTTIGRPCIPFLSANTLLGHEVRVRTLQTRRHHRFVVINHDVVFSCHLDDPAVMADTGLTFVPL